MKKALLGIATLSIGMTGGLLGIQPAQAVPDRDPEVITTPAQVWTQSFGRESATAPCVVPTELDIPWQSNWNPNEKAWTPTWEQWANGGKGGWTCTRSITWAPGSQTIIQIIV